MTVSLIEAWQNIENHLKADAESVAQRVENDLPEVAKFLGDAAQNPVLLALGQAAHLTALPEGLTMVANFIQGVDASIAAAKAQGAAEAQQPAEPPAA